MNLVSVDREKNINTAVDLYKKYVDKIITATKEAPTIKIAFLFLL